MTHGGEFRISKSTLRSTRRPWRRFPGTLARGDVQDLRGSCQSSCGGPCSLCAGGVSTPPATRVENPPTWVAGREKEQTGGRVFRVGIGKLKEMNPGSSPCSCPRRGHRRAKKAALVHTPGPGQQSWGCPGGCCGNCARRSMGSTSACGRGNAAPRPHSPNARRSHAVRTNGRPIGRPFMRPVANSYGSA